MYIDLYGKVVLTVIAACLLWHVAADLMVARRATAQLQSDVVDVRIVGHALATDDAVPVAVTSY